jgi:PAS domain S-box-containing protein
MKAPYLVSSLPAHELAELHRLMNEEIQEVAVFFMNPEGIITVWNRAAEEMKGYTANEAIGSHLRTLYTEEDVAKKWPEHNLGEARKNGFYKEETWRRKKDGSLFWARIALTALHDHSGHLVGFSKVTVDLTEHKRLEECIKEKEAVSRVLRVANAGTWTWHPDRNQMEVSKNFLGLLGYEHEEMDVTFEQWLDFVDEQDRDGIARQFENALANRPRVPIISEARMCRKDGNCRWYSLHAEWHREKEGDPYILSGVNVDIEDVKSAGEQLQHAVSDLRSADIRKDEFLAMLAHELRNPLAPIRAAAELLKMVTLDDAVVRKTSEIIARQVDHMTGLVDDLLDVSRVTRGLVQLDKAPLYMTNIVTDAVEQVRPLIQSRRHHLRLHLAPDMATVMGDSKRLVQVIANLLNNAAKYTHEGGNILLMTEVGNGKITLKVIDDGIGMEPELTRRVFDLFAQAERTPDRSSGGLGLGLALVKSLIELHGGSVTAASEGIGKGSVFSICLPLTSVQNGPAAQLGGALAEQTRPLKILLVDDNVDAAQMLAMLLEAAGHEVLVEYGAKRALERALIEKPDICLLDIGLPEMDGNELARRIKARAENTNAVLIAVTGYGQDSDRLASMAAGFSHHFVKPVDTERLLALLGKIAADTQDRQ